MNRQVYLYNGPEFGERDDAVAAVKDSFKKKFGAVDEHSFYLQETPFSQIMTILQSGTLFSDGVCVVCKNAELLKKKDELSMLSDWLGSESDDKAVLIFVSDEISVDAKLDKLIPPANKKKFYEKFDSDKIPWLTGFFRKNGYQIKNDAAELVLDFIENNTQALKTECSRFFVLFPKEHQITVEDVEKVLTHSREENAFTLFNQIAEPTLAGNVRFEKALAILQSIRLSKENSSVMIIAGLASCFRKLILWHESGEAAFPSRLMQNQYRKAARIWTKGQSSAILALLASTDMEIRSGGSAMEDILLSKLLFEIVVKKGASMETAQYDVN